MATLAELAGLRSDPGYSALVDKIIAACVIKAQVIAANATATAAQIAWAKTTLSNPKAQADQVVWYVLAANKAATVAQIIGAADTAIQTNVDSAVDSLLGK